MRNHILTIVYGSGYQEPLKSLILNSAKYWNWTFGAAIYNLVKTQKRHKVELKCS